MSSTILSMISSTLLGLEPLLGSSKLVRLLRLPLLLLLPEMSSFVPSAITQPFFELQTPDFAWKFVWTVLTNYSK